MNTDVEWDIHEDMKTMIARLREDGRKEQEDRRKSYNSRRKDTSYLKKYGLTQADYDKMEEEQYGLCAICGEENVNGRKLFVDHNHDTGKVRGLLCSSCNTGLGFMKDNPRVVFSAAEYLVLYDGHDGGDNGRLI